MWLSLLVIGIPFLVELFPFFFFEILVHIVVEPRAMCCDDIGIVDFGNVMAYEHVWFELIIVL